MATLTPCAPLNRPSSSVCHGAPCKIKGRNSNPLSNNQRKKQALRQARQSVSTMAENERMIYIHEPGATNNRVASIKYHHDPETRTLRYGATLYTAPSDAAQRAQQVYCTAVAETLTSLMREGMDVSAFDGMMVQGCQVAIHKATVEEVEGFFESEEEDLDLAIEGMSLQEPTNGGTNDDESDDAEDEDYEDSNANSDAEESDHEESAAEESECGDASECDGECDANADCNAECDEDAQTSADEDYDEDPDLDAEEEEDDEDNLEENQAEEADSDEDEENQSETFSENAESESFEVMSVSVSNPLFPVEPFRKKQSRALAHHRFALSPIVLHNVGPWLLPTGATDYKAMDAFVRKCMYEHGAYARRHPRNAPQQQDQENNDEEEDQGSKANEDSEAVEDTGCPPA